LVDIDLKSFFDEVDHCILLQLLHRKVKLSEALGHTPAYSPMATSPDHDWRQIGQAKKRSATR
jgi:hypothetical protein